MFDPADEKSVAVRDEPKPPVERERMGLRADDHVRCPAFVRDPEKRAHHGVGRALPPEIWQRGDPGNQTLGPHGRREGKPTRGNHAPVDRDVGMHPVPIIRIAELTLDDMLLVAKNARANLQNLGKFGGRFRVAHLKSGPVRNR